ncbi:putative phage head-tail connector protein (p21) [uncultured Mediterranean phage uvMED]|nr:putative phage head-tail connector protein (p21) [uncultured Mediterranean phage uvMED]
MKTKRQQLLTRWGHLRSERATWWSHWQEVTTYLLPRNGRYFEQDRNKGHRRHNSIYDNTGTRALRTLGAGMMAGATSPARPWFRLGTTDPDLNKFPPVQLWLSDVTERMQLVFTKSNTYRTLHGIYEELGAFGTAGSIVLPDSKNAIHHYPVTIGEYAIATDYQGRVNTLFREFQKTVGETVREFGYNKCSTSVKNLYDRGSLDQWITIIHGIEPRDDRERDYKKKDNMNMKYKSCYFEQGGDGEQVLRESGFRDFPAIIPRWGIAGGDVYGNSPGMEALGDVKQLQHEQLRKAQGIDYQTKPPLQVPSYMKNRDVDSLPGGVTFIDGQQGKIETAFNVNLNLNHLLQDIQDVRGRINSSFYADLFLMLANATDTRMTATEVAERHEEKLLMLGPVLERLHNELLDPLIDNTFNRMVEAGLVPPAPEELQGTELNVEFVSMLAQAQRAIGTNSVDRYTNSMGMIAQMKPDVLDKFDSDKWANAYGEMLGIDPELIVPDKQVARIRQERAQAQQQMAQREAQQEAVENMTKLNNSKTGEPSMMDVVGQFSGYNSPTPLEV